MSWEGAFGALTQMDATDAEKANARRVQRLLYGLMIVLIGAIVAFSVLTVNRLRDDRRNTAQHTG